MTYEYQLLSVYWLSITITIDNNFPTILHYFLKSVLALFLYFFNKPQYHGACFCAMITAKYQFNVNSAHNPQVCREGGSNNWTVSSIEPTFFEEQIDF